MIIFDQLMALVLVIIVVLLAAAGWRAIDRVYHWRRTLDRVERTEWDRVLAALRSPGVE